MHINLDQVLVEVSQSEFLHIENPVGMTFFCVSGNLWITKENCIRDFEVAPGTSYAADSTQSITVCGFEPSIVRIFQPSRAVFPTNHVVALKKLRQSWIRFIENLG